MNEQEGYFQRTIGLQNVNGSDLRFLPEVGKADFKRWRDSKLRIDEWIAREYPESNLAKRRAPQIAEPLRQREIVMEPVASTFGLHEPLESDAWAEGRE